MTGSDAGSHDKDCEEGGLSALWYKHIAEVESYVHDDSYKLVKAAIDSGEPLTTHLIREALVHIDVDLRLIETSYLAYDRDSELPPTIEHAESVHLHVLEHYVYCNACGAMAHALPSKRLARKIFAELEYIDDVTELLEVSIDIYVREGEYGEAIGLGVEVFSELKRRERERIRRLRSEVVAYRKAYFPFAFERTDSSFTKALTDIQRVAWKILQAEKADGRTDVERRTKIITDHNSRCRPNERVNRSSVLAALAKFRGKLDAKS